jgi:Gas vesicle protein G
MGLLTMIVGLPVAPVRGLFAVGRLLQEQVNQQLYDPTQVRRQIEEIEAAQAEGELSDEAAQEQQQEAVDRLLGR